MRLTLPKRIELMSQGYWSGDGCRKGSPLARSVIVGGTFQPTPLAEIGDLCLRARYPGRTIASIAIRFLSGSLTRCLHFQVFIIIFVCLFYIHNHLDRYLTTSLCCVLLP